MSQLPKGGLFPEWLAAHAAEQIAPSLRVMQTRYGQPAAGIKCKDCAHLIGHQHARVYWKCKLFGDTNGPATDWRVNWPGCGAFHAEAEAPGATDATTGPVPFTELPAVKDWLAHYPQSLHITGRELHVGDIDD